MFLSKLNNIFYLLIISTWTLCSQSIFSEDYQSQADVKVYVVDYISQADLAVFKVEYKSQSEGNNGLWYFVNYRSQSDKSIFFVCLLYTSPSPRDRTTSRMPSSA